jgi:hypothetical protein
MLDPAACAHLGFGAPRVAVSALAELHHLLASLGFRRSSTTDVVQETRHEAVPTAADDCSAPAESVACPDWAGAAAPDERREVVALLAALLAEAARGPTPETANDGE